MGGPHWHWGRLRQSLGFGLHAPCHGHPLCRSRAYLTVASVWGLETPCHPHTGTHTLLHCRFGNSVLLVSGSRLCHFCPSRTQGGCRLLLHGKHRVPGTTAHNCRVSSAVLHARMGSPQQLCRKAKGDYWPFPQHLFQWVGPVLLDLNCPEAGSVPQLASVDRGHSSADVSIRWTADGSSLSLLWDRELPSKVLS